MTEKKTEKWDIWFPQAAATGLAFARAEIDPTETVIVHSAPPVMAVTVTGADGQVIAAGEGLERTLESPMTRLRREGGTLLREDIWPEKADVGTIVILPGGEAGVLVSWWNAPDQSEWRWQVEFFNRKG
jgi:hypothetical protein